ncbi:MAG: hypothetical protein ACTSWL_04645 [Promethearchaeota archaeon]
MFSDNYSRVRNSNPAPRYSLDVPIYHQDIQGHSMVPQWKKRTVIDQKADLYSILSTVQYLKQRFDEGRINAGQYVKNLKFFHHQMASLQEELQSQNKTVLELADGLHINSDLKSMLTVLSSAQDYKFNRIAQEWQLNPYELAAVATSTTSSFITLLDYLHLVEDFDQEFLFGLFKDLSDNLSRIQSLKPFLDEISKLVSVLPKYFAANHVFENPDGEKIRTLYSQIEDQVYKTFKQFQEHLNLQDPF